MFEVGFRVEVDPEFAPDGGEVPRRFPPDLPRVGAILRVTAPDAEPWDLAIGAPGWWRHPDARALAFISDWTGYVVDVVARRVLVEQAGVARMWEAEQSGLLLMCTAGDLIALDAEGVAWRSDGLVVDDLKVVATNRERILCRGLTHDGVATGIASEFSVDPATGALLSGAPQ